jgi:MarR family transcriptional regulator for hemolysin
MSFQSIGLQIHLLSRQWRCLLDKQLLSLGLTQSSGIALAYIAEYQGVTQTELAKFLGVETPSLVPVLDQLEKMQLIARCPSPHDRRQKVLQLQPAAAPLVQSIHQQRQLLQQQLLANLTAEQQQLLPQLLDLVLQQAAQLQQVAKQPQDNKSE